MAVHTNANTRWRGFPPFSLLTVMSLFLIACCDTPTPVAEPSPQSSSADQAGGNADVLHVRAVQTAPASAASGEGSAWTFHVTVKHPDQGWEDYADGWDAMTPDGTVLKSDPGAPFTRPLLHPHVNEQPFTRTQADIEIPPDVTQVNVRAHDVVDGFGGREVTVDLTVPSGPDFEVVGTAD